MKVRFLCPSCEYPGGASLPAREAWRCPSCSHTLVVNDPPRTQKEDEVTLHACAVCGNHELYKMKGFPHWLGLGILVISCVAFFVLNAYRQQWWAWAALIGSAAIDGVLYLLVKDVAVCYRCGAHHRGFGHSGNSPFELTVGERYRQERLRLEEARQASARENARENARGKGDAREPQTAP